MPSWQAAMTSNARFMQELFHNTRRRCDNIVTNITSSDSHPPQRDSRNLRYTRKYTHADSRHTGIHTNHDLQNPPTIQTYNTPQKSFIQQAPISTNQRAQESRRTTNPANPDLTECLTTLGFGACRNSGFGVSCNSAFWGFLQLCILALPVTLHFGAFCSSAFWGFL